MLRVCDHLGMAAVSSSSCESEVVFSRFDVFLVLFKFATDALSHAANVDYLLML